VYSGIFVIQYFIALEMYYFIIVPDLKER